MEMRLNTGKDVGFTQASRPCEEQSRISKVFSFGPPLGAGGTYPRKKDPKEDRAAERPESER